MSKTDINKKWVHLHGDRFIYTQLEDGCRGTEVMALIHEYDSNSIKNAKRVVQCVNAMRGIDNPEEWVAKAKILMNQIE